MKSKVAPVGLEDQKLPEGKKRVSFSTDSSQKEQSTVTISQDSSPPAPASLVSQGDEKSIARERIIAKTASCPQHIFPGPEKAEVKTGRVDGIDLDSIPSSKQKRGPGRQRARSMPAGSLASHDFFGDPNFRSVRLDPGTKMGKLSEDHVLRDDGKDLINVPVRVKEEHPMGLEKVTAEPVEKPKKQTVVDTTTLKSEVPKIEQDTSQKCQCIIL